MFTDGVAELCEAVRDLDGDINRDFDEYDRKEVMEPVVDHPHMMQNLRTRYEHLQRLWLDIANAENRVNDSKDEEARRILDGLKETLGNCAQSLEEYEQIIPNPAP